jgi:hypothetical protein
MQGMQGRFFPLLSREAPDQRWKSRPHVSYFNRARLRP